MFKQISTWGSLVYHLYNLRAHSFSYLLGVRGEAELREARVGIERDGGSRSRSTPRPSPSRAEQSSNVKAAEASASALESESESECYLELELYHKRSDRLLTWRVHVRDVNDHSPSFNRGSAIATGAGVGPGGEVRHVYASEAVEELQVPLPSAEDPDSCRGQRALRYTLTCLGPGPSPSGHANTSFSSSSLSPVSKSPQAAQASSILSGSSGSSRKQLAPQQVASAAAHEQCPFELRVAQPSGRPVLQVVRALDRERREEYALLLTAHDRAVPPRSAALALRLHVRPTYPTAGPPPSSLTCSGLYCTALVHLFSALYCTV